MTIMPTTHQSPVASHQPLLVGAHVSTAGGIDNGPKRAKEIGCNCVQIFCSSPRMWSKTKHLKENILTYKQKAADCGILETVVHAQYLVNLASDNPELREKSRVSIGVDMDAAAGIGAVGVVVHVGSHQGRGWDTVKEQVAKEIGQLLTETPDDSVFLIENAAGQKGKIGSDLREIRWLLDQLQAGKRVGWCLDSCHAFAAGYSFVPMDGEKYLFDWIAEQNLQDTLKVVHVNDTRDPYVSRNDRHANLYDGFIGKELMGTFLKNPIFTGLPFILEVPGAEGLGPDKENVMRLRTLLE